MKKQWQIPDTFILIFLVGVFATVLTYLIPAGSFTQQEISYVVDGVEKTRSVVDPESFKVALNEQGEPVYNSVGFFCLWWWNWLNELCL